ncbi:MAG: SDR family oxidoreductase [Tannerellaceae bacterium]|jgi:3-oxoacyl-[acyl-carrier protein] reductase|nr:SDR family oxidoreductase [Tannerellaceae bacterium]
MEKRIIITGGTKGIGKAVALALGKEGYDLLLTYASDEAAAADTREELLQTAPGCDVRLLKADITDMRSIDLVCDCVAGNGMCLDAIVFNAGLTCRTPFEKMQPGEWEKVFSGNIHFPVFLLQRLIGHIRRGGSVVFTGSLMGIQPHAVSLAYGVTKSSVHALVKNLVKILIPYGIRVNGVAPGFVDTEWQKNKPLEIRHNIEDKIAMKRFCSPAELAGVYKMLIENSYFNGEIIVADGGYSYK